MKIVKGKLIRKGGGQQHWGWQYEIIEIGDQTLRGVRAPRLISSVLDEGEEMELRIHKVFFIMKFIISVRHSNGRRYRTPLYSLLAPSLLLSPQIFTVGILFLADAPPVGAALVGLSVLSPVRDVVAWARS